MLFPKPEQAATILRRERDGLTVEYGRLDAAGEFDFVRPKNAMVLLLHRITKLLGQCED